MSTEQVQQERKASEEDVNNVISWLISEFETIDQSAIVSKEDRIKQGAEKLKEMGLRPKAIAAELARHAKELHVARSWIYEVLPVEYKRQERSDAIKEGKKPMSGGGQSTSNEQKPVSRGPLGGANTEKSMTVETLTDIVNAVIASAVSEGDYYKVPKETFEKMVMAAPRVAV